MPRISWQNFEKFSKDLNTRLSKFWDAVWYYDPFIFYLKNQKNLYKSWKSDIIFSHQKIPDINTSFKTGIANLYNSFSKFVKISKLPDTKMSQRFKFLESRLFGTLHCYVNKTPKSLLKSEKHIIHCTLHEKRTAPMLQETIKSSMTCTFINKML